MKAGLMAARDTPHKGLLLTAYLAGAVLVWLFRGHLFGLDAYGMFSPVLNAVIDLLVPLYAVGGLLAVLVLLGTPWGGREAKEGLQKVGLVNHAGEAPILLCKQRDKDTPRLTLWEFDPCGIPLGEWEDKRARIETALNITIPYHEVEALARVLLPEIQAFFESEEGQREFAEWKAQQEQNKVKQD